MLAAVGILEEGLPGGFWVAQRFSAAIKPASLKTALAAEVTTEL
jgi:hypothetical protein